MTKVKLAVGLVLLLGLLGSSTPNITDLGVVMWSEVNISAEGELGNWGLAGGSNLQYPAMAIDGTVYSYANPSGISYTLFMSTKAGYSWSYIGRGLRIL